MGCSSAVEQRSISEEILNSRGGKSVLRGKVLYPIIAAKLANNALISSVS